MRFWYDCEFLDDGKIVDLISIGMVSEDGREYYAINMEADWARISQHPWLPTNVLPHLPGDWNDRWYATKSGLTEWRPDRLHKDVKVLRQIADDVEAFICIGNPDRDENELWSWFAAYDHVALAQLWGAMNDLPQCVPMFTNDLEQERRRLGSPKLPDQSNITHFALEDARYHQDIYRYLKGLQRGV